MAEYIEKNHFDERIRIAVGMCEGDLTSDFKDGVLFVLNLLKSEENADVIPIPEGATNGDMIKAIFPNAIKSNYIESSMDFEDYVEVYLGDYLMRVSYDWWNTPYRKEEE